MVCRVSTSYTLQCSRLTQFITRQSNNHLYAQIRYLFSHSITYTLPITRNNLNNQTSVSSCFVFVSPVICYPLILIVISLPCKFRVMCHGPLLRINPSRNASTSSFLYRHVGIRCSGQFCITLLQKTQKVLLKF